MAGRKETTTASRGGRPAEPAPEPAETVDHPDHYNQGAVECITAIESALGRDGFAAFLRGQVIKYQWRLAGKGDPLEDARKSLWYAQRLVDVLRAAENP